MTRCANDCGMIGDSRVFDCVYLDEDTGREVPSYGVQLSYEDGQLLSVPDVSLKREEALGLAALLRGRDVAPDILPDIVRDYVEGL